MNVRSVNSITHFCDRKGYEFSLESDDYFWLRKLNTTMPIKVEFHKLKSGHWLNARYSLKMCQYVSFDTKREWRRENKDNTFCCEKTLSDLAKHVHVYRTPFAAVQALIV